MNLFLGFLVNFLSSDAAKQLIALAIDKLLAHTNDGVTKDIALTMIDGIAKSKANPTTEDLFSAVVNLLKGGN